jgi:hypothetical protein
MFWLVIDSEAQTQEPEPIPGHHADEQRRRRPTMQSFDHGLGNLGDDGYSAILEAVNPQTRTCERQPLSDSFGWNVAHLIQANPNTRGEAFREWLGTMTDGFGQNQNPG